MRLLAYLLAVGETEAEFVGRCRVPQAVVNRAINGEGCSLQNAHKIVQATRARPTDDGMTVRFEDLLPHPRPKPRKRGRKPGPGKT